MRALLAVLVAAWLALPADAKPQTAPEHASATVPITTTSEEARRLYLEARLLAEELHGADAYEKYGEAVAADAEFALGHFGQAQNAPTAAAFFESLERAVALADRASPGERQMILALQAAGNGDVGLQRKHLEALVAAHPQDARAHFQLGQFLFGQQEYEPAIQHFSQAAELDPRFTTPQNMLGYANRSLERYDASERAFLKYIELLPNEPNPLDSYAELLMKTGRFEESIASYRKALELDPSFTPSFIGIGYDEVLLGRHADARATFQQMHDQAPNDGVRRGALLWTTVSYLHEGKRTEALETIRRMYAIAEAADDRVAMSGDLVFMGAVELENGGDPDEALAKFREGLAMSDQADAPEEAKELTRRTHLYNEALVAIWKGDVEKARALAGQHREQVEVLNALPEVQLVHELAGRVALMEKDPDRAIAELEQANQQDPRILWALSQAHAQKGDAAGAKALAEDTADFNQLSVTYGYVRNDAREALESST